MLDLDKLEGRRFEEIVPDLIEEIRRLRAKDDHQEGHTELAYQRARETIRSLRQEAASCPSKDHHNVVVFTATAV